MKNFLLPILLVLLSFSFLEGSSITGFNWEEFAEMPPGPDQSVQPGVAGAFTGVHQDALIIAGGANFPNGPAWEGGSKVYHSDIYVLEKVGEEYRWLEGKSFSLPRPLAYGLTIGTEEGLVCMGGMDGEKVYDEVRLLQWDPISKEIRTDTWPTLPIPLANLTGGKIGDQIYVAGSSEGDGSKYFWSLNLQDPTAGWKDLPVWPGAPRTHAVGVVQNDGEDDCFYLIKGRYRQANGMSDLFSDVQIYHPPTNSWEVAKTFPGEVNSPLAAPTAVAAGANHILVFGGDTGELFNSLEQLGVDIQESTDTLLRKRMIHERDSLMNNHPGFSKAIWSFHTITHAWTKLGELPSGSQVTTTAVNWDGHFLIPSGEISPCIRTPQVWRGKLTYQPNFGTINYIVLGVYLCLLVGLGLWFSKNQRSTEDFFKGGQRIPWWAAGFSIFGTQLSAITFMAVPAKTFATNWLYFIMSMTIIMISPFIVRFFLPFYRRLNLTTAYEYLEIRFNLATRLIGSVMYFLLQLGRLGIVLLLPSLALSVVTGIDVYLCILTMGLLSIFYTVTGGIEAVIWTDVLQVIVLMGGAILSLIMLWWNLDGQLMETYISRFQKMQIFDFELSLSDPTLWVVLFGGLAANMTSYGSDQTVIQRYLTTKDEKSAAKGIITSAWMSLPSTLTFFLLGTLLFVFYKVHPEALSPVIEKTDSIFPWYIVNTLPDGVAGLLIAAIFAASMSSLDSSMNSVATVFTTDFFRRLRPLPNEAAYLRLARWITVLVGLLGTTLALWMARSGISSLWDQFNMIIGLFAGGLGGIFVLGIFFRRANGVGALIGLLLSGVVQYLVRDYTSIHLLFYAFTGMTSAVVIGYLASLIFKEGEKTEEKLTIYSLRKRST